MESMKIITRIIIETAVRTLLTDNIIIIPNDKPVIIVSSTMIAAATINMLNIKIIAIIKKRPKTKIKIKTDFIIPQGPSVLSYRNYTIE